MAKGNPLEECSRSRFSGANPPLSSFFKIMLGERFSQYLFFPPLFVPAVASLVSQGTFLKDANGRQWRVRFAKVDGSLALGKGWSDFVKHHRLVHGDFVVFDLVESHFKVRMYGISGCEKMSAPQTLDKTPRAPSEEGQFKATEKAASSAKEKRTRDNESGQHFRGKCSRNEGSLRNPFVVDVDMDQGQPKTNRGGCSDKHPQVNENGWTSPLVADVEMEGKKPKAKETGCDKSDVPISRSLNKRASSGFDLQQAKMKCGKKDKETVEQVLNANVYVSRKNKVPSSCPRPQHLDCEWSRDVRLYGLDEVEAAHNYATGTGNSHGMPETAPKPHLFEDKKRKYGDSTPPIDVSEPKTYTRRSNCGQNKVAATAEERTTNPSTSAYEYSLKGRDKSVAGFTKDIRSNICKSSQRQSSPHLEKELGEKALHRGKRLSGLEHDDLWKMADGQSSYSPVRGTTSKTKVKAEPLDSESSPYIPRPISCVIPDETLAHIDLGVPLPMLRGRLSLKRRVVMLRDPSTRLWPVLCQKSKTSSAILRGGWGYFLRANKIRAGDECVFMAEDCSSGVYNVQIVRHRIN